MRKVEEVRKMGMHMVVKIKGVPHTLEECRQGAYLPSVSH